MRAVDQRLQRVEIDLDQLVIRSAVVRAKLGGYSIGRIGYRFTAGGLQICRHVLVVGEHRTGRTDLGTHVAHGGLTRSRNGVGTRPEVLDDSAGATFHRQDAGDFEDDVFRRRPTRKCAGETYADHLGPADVKREAGQYVDRVSTADANGHHAEAASVGGVAVCADHHAAREAVMLEHDLMDDARPGPPEPDAVLGRHAPQKVVHLAVGIDGNAHVDLGTLLGADEVIAMHGGRNGHLGQAGGHELEQRHLRGGILHSNPIGMEVGVAAAPFHLLILRVGEVVDEDLFGQREGSSEALATECRTGRKGGIDGRDEFVGGSGACGHGGLLWGDDLYTSIRQVP